MAHSNTEDSDDDQAQAQTLNKLIAMRGGQRAWVTKKIRTANTMFLILKDSPLEDEMRQDLVILKETLSKRLKQLDEMNMKVQELLPVTDIENDIAECYDREEEITSIIQKISKLQVDKERSSEKEGDDTLKEKHYTNLPKLNLPTFDGDPKQWTPFWDLYSATVHDNEKLSPIQKLSYLRTLLKGSAASCIIGIRNTNDNYEVAINTLKERYNKPSFVRSLHLNELLNLPRISDINATKALREHFNSISAMISNLETVGLEIENYEALLAPLLIQSLPERLQMKIAAETKDELTVQNVLKHLLEHVESKERFQSFTDKIGKKFPDRDKGERKPPDPHRARSYAFNTYSSKLKCHFCLQDDHSSVQCRKISDVHQRKRIIQERKLCRNCLQPGHFAGDCRSKNRCSVCKGRHHTAICLKNRVNNQSAMSPHNYRSQQRPTTSGAKINTPQQHQQQPGQQKQEDQLPHGAISDSNNNFHISNLTQSKNKAHIFLQTAVAEIMNPETGQSINARILFDDGSMHSYISEELAKFLNLPVVARECFEIETFGNTVSKSVNSNTVKLQINKKNFKFQTEMYTAPYICNALPNARLSPEAMNELSKFELADNLLLSEPNLAVAILIGSDHYWDFIIPHIFKTFAGPMAVSSQLGILLSGPLHIQSIATYFNFSNMHHMNFISHVSLADNYNTNNDNDLNFKLEQFYTLESLGILPEHQEATILNEFEKTIEYLPEQCRYVVKLPWKDFMKEKLDSNLWMAKKRLDSLCGKLHKLQNKPNASDIETNIVERYQNIIDDQVNQGIIKRVDIDVDDNIVDICKNQADCYIPHNCVIKPGSTSSPVRIVYDGSARRASKPSLNQCLHAGPSLIVNLCELLNKFRLNQIGIVSDISKAFLNIEVHEQDQNSLRFLWKDFADPSGQLLVYQFQRIPFGLTSSPFLLLGTINFHLRQFSVKFPIASLLKDKFYMDDLVTSVNDYETAIDLFKYGSELMSLANMKLCKWNSNCSQVREYFKEKEPECNPPILQLVLGVEWDLINDELNCVIKPVIDLANNVTPTKRSILSVVASIFDPLGVLSAFTLPAKQIFQCLCKLNVNWDETLPKSILSQWKVWVKSLPLLLNVSLSRYIFKEIAFENGIPQNVEIHCFADASKQGYCSIVYLRVFDKFNEPHVKFVMSKSRVAPLKQLTLPRLELMGALLSVRLTSTVLKFLSEVNISNVYYYTDSENVLHWVKSPEKTWSVFVNHRLREIRTLSKEFQWFHVPGSMNPADIGTRSNAKLNNEHLNLWLHGPGFLRNDSLPADSNVDLNVTPECLLSELTKTKSVNLVQVKNVVNISNLIDVNKYSDYSRLLSVTFFILKAIKLFKKAKVEQSELIHEAEILLIKSIQISSFPVEYNEAPCNENINLPVKGKMQTPLLKQLGLFKDQSGILRCRTRLEHAGLTFDSKYPILIPRKNHFTKLLILNRHCKLFHAGVSHTLNQIRQEFWIPRGRREVRNILGGCLTCVRLKAQPYVPPNAPALPKFRVSGDRIFCYVGCDFAGPIYFKPVDSKKPLKSYICIFTCLVSRAIKLELTSSLSTTCFILALRRFISSYGVPKLIVSDNARTFQSAAKELKALFQPEILQKFCLSNKISWKFNLPLSPWEGGVFERLVRIVKNALRSTLSKTLLSYEEIQTTLSEIEICLNSRPLTYVNDEINENKAISPAMLMYGHTNTIMPPLNMVSAEVLPSDTKFASRRMRYLDRIQQEFWTRWTKDYLQFLTESHFSIRGRSDNPSRTPKIGQIVLVKDPLKARYLWKMGRIDQMFPGRDGQIRSLEIKIVSNENDKRCAEKIRRSPQMVVPLELELKDEPNNHEDD